MRPAFGECVILHTLIRILPNALHPHALGLLVIPVSTIVHNGHSVDIPRVPLVLVPPDLISAVVVTRMYGLLEFMAVVAMVMVVTIRPAFSATPAQRVFYQEAVKKRDASRDDT
eukprot:1177443-Prorocentrum_minimum.AAC.2